VSLSDPINVTIVLLLFALVWLIEWADRRDLVARWFDRARVRFGRRMPLGRHRIEGEVGIHFGRDDTILILTVPLQAPGEQRSSTFVAATDNSTRFTVNQEDASPDELLAAYDDSVGPLLIQVDEPGRIAEIGIAPDAHLPGAST
jgi:hypothetical protein